jgi:hypothetical protein
MNITNFVTMYIYRCTIVVLSFKLFKTPKYGFAKGFHDCTEDVVCTKYFALIRWSLQSGSFGSPKRSFLIKWPKSSAPSTIGRRPRRPRAAVRVSTVQFFATRVSLSTASLPCDALLSHLRPGGTPPWRELILP